jgi:hypothetical protein
MKRNLQHHRAHGDFFERSDRLADVLLHHRVSKSIAERVLPQIMTPAI